MRHPIAFGVWFFLVMGSSVFASSLELTARPNHSLPGVPVSLTIRSNGIALDSPFRGVLLVSPNVGKAFVASCTESRVTCELSSEQAEGLSQNRLDFPLDSQLMSPGWFSDRRLSFPGTYRLQLVINPEWSAIGDDGTLLKNVTGEASVVSNVVTLVIEKPIGDDLGVWKRMNELTNGKGFGGFDWGNFGFGLAREISQDFPSSAYFTYVALLIPEEDENARIVNCERALANEPNGPMAEVVRLGLANLHQFASSRAFTRHDDETALREAARAREQLNIILTRGSDPAVKRQASKKKTELLSEEKIKERRSAP